MLLFTALFEDGDVPGERMFSFHSKKNKTYTKKSTSSQHSENHNKDDQKMSNICPQGKLLH